jgi:hypothetical protein
MRMPLLSYFLVVGAVLFGGLILVSSQLASKLPVSQRIGVPPPFKAPPDQTQSPTSGADSTADSNVVCFGPIADMCSATTNVRFIPKSGLSDLKGNYYAQVCAPVTAAEGSPAPHGPVDVQFAPGPVPSMQDYG